MKHKMPKVSELAKKNFVYWELPDTSIPTAGQLEHLSRLSADTVIFGTCGERLFYLHQHEFPSTDQRIPWRPSAAIFQNKPWSFIISQLLKNDYILIEDESFLPVGYITANDVLGCLHNKYLFLDAAFTAMIDTLDASVSMIDDEGRTQVWTKGAERIFSIKSKDILGKSITNFFPLDMLETLKTLNSGESVTHKLHQPRPDLYVLINTNPIRIDGKIVGSVCAETDITRQFRLSQELSNAAAKVQHLQQKMAQLRPYQAPFHDIKGSSAAILNTIDICRKIGTTKATVLILGESGVGKELFAKGIHDVREKQDAPFIAINCGAIPPSLFESELFGYEKGAFSGADQNGKKGKIELARDGTLFLDEIAEMPLEMQVKLLRVLQERKYYAVGGTKQLHADFRVIAATNRDLEEQVRKGLFREDLYYRLNVVTIEIPPLRERKEDVIELSHYFLHEFSLSYNRYIETIPQVVLLDLMHYEWPGNIRELRNTIERLVVFSTDGEIKHEYLPASFRSKKKEADESVMLYGVAEPIQTLQKELDIHERNIIVRVLEIENGNKQAAAKRLGMSRATLYNKMNKLGMKDL